MRNFCCWAPASCALRPENATLLGTRATPAGLGGVRLIWFRPTSRDHNDDRDERPPVEGNVGEAQSPRLKRHVVEPMASRIGMDAAKTVCDQSVAMTFGVLGARLTKTYSTSSARGPTQRKGQGGASAAQAKKTERTSASMESGHHADTAEKERR